MATRRPGADVLNLLRTDWWKAYQQTQQPNSAATKFVQNVLQDTTLYKGYSTALSASQKQQSLDPVNSWLQQQGYDCTAVQVNAAFHQMRSVNLNFWTGIYGQTTITQDTAKPQAGPALIVYGDTNVSLGAVRIYDPAYDNGVLSWGPKSKDGTFDNPCAASLTFSQVSMPLTATSYVGNEFDGTLDYGTGGTGPHSGKVGFAGRIGEPPPNQPGKVVTPPSYHRSAIEEIFKYINYFVIAHMAISALASMPKALTEAKEWFKSKFPSRAAAEGEDAASEASEVSDTSPLVSDDFSEATTIQLLESENPPDLAAREQAVADEEADAEEAEEADVEGSADVDGGASEEDLLEDILEDV